MGFDQSFYSPLLLSRRSIGRRRSLVTSVTTPINVGTSTTSLTLLCKRSPLTPKVYRDTSLTRPRLHSTSKNSMVPLVLDKPSPIALTSIRRTPPFRSKSTLRKMSTMWGRPFFKCKWEPPSLSPCSLEFGLDRMEAKRPLHGNVLLSSKLFKYSIAMSSRYHAAPLSAFSSIDKPRRLHVMPRTPPSRR